MNKKFKLAKVIFFLVIIVVFLIIRLIGKDSNEEEVSINDIFEGSKLLTYDNVSNDKAADQEDSKNVDGLSINKFSSNPDMNLYEEDTENEVYGDEVFIRYKLMNGELLYDKKLPLGVFNNMLENYQIYFNQIEVDAPISEVTIIDDSIEVTNDTLKYDLLTDTDVTIRVEVDLYSFEYTFKNK